MSTSSIRARLNAATKGPWIALMDKDDQFFVGPKNSPAEAIAELPSYSGREDEADAEFIAHSRTDIELLLAVAGAAKRLDVVEPIEYREGFDGKGFLYCLYCEAEVPDGTPGVLPHTETCPWALNKTALSALEADG